MKIAKASVADLEMAFELVGAVDMLNSLWGAAMPEKIAKPRRDDEEECFSLDDDEKCRRVCEYLIRLTRSASLSRVVSNAASSEGVAMYKGWLAGLNAEQKDAIRPHHAEWSAKAKKIDAAERPAEDQNGE